MNIQVGGHGPKDCKICFIGEALGYDEVKSGIPFSGSSGQMLDKLMQSAGINREECYVTNVIKERPINNDVSIFISIPKDRRGTVKTTEAYREYEEYLHEELQSINANVIVPVGNVALYATMRLIQISARRGSIFHGYVPAIRNRKVIAIVHPSSLLRGYLGRRVCIEDLVRIKKEAEFPEFRLTKRELIIRPSYQSSLEYLDRCEQIGVAAYDIEVDKRSREISCISFSYDKHSAISIPFMSKGRDYFSHPQEREIWLAIGNLLENTSVKKLVHNGSFDNCYVFEKGGIVTKNFDDTMVAMGIVTPDYAKTLHFCTSLYTDVPYYKEEGQARIHGMGGSDESFWEYNAKDSIVLHEIWDEIYTDLVSMGNLPTYIRQMKMVDPMIYATNRGIKMDMDGKQIEVDNNERKANILIDEIKKETNGVITKPKSVLQIRQYFYFDLGIKPVMNKGIMSTDANALKKLTGRGYPLASKILRARQYKDRNSKFINQPMSPDGRLRGSFNVVGTKPGRFSHSKNIHEEGFNIQTPPHEVRQYMLADEGHFIMDIDLNQGESRIVAYLAPEPNMIHAFEYGIDIHAQTGSMISSLPIEEVIKQHKENIFCHLGDGLHTWRFWGKKCDHGFNYGMGPVRFATECEISVKEGKFLWNRYHAIYPGVRMFHQWVDNHLRRHDMTLVNPYGRVRRFLGRMDEATVRETVDHLCQSTVADKVDEEGIAFMWENQQWFRHFEILNQMHDSIDPQIPLHTPRLEIADALLRLRDNLNKPITWRGVDFKIPVGLSLGFNFMEGSDKQDDKGSYIGNPLGLREIDFMKFTEASELAKELNNVLGHLSDLKNRNMNE